MDALIPSHVLLEIFLDSMRTCTKVERGFDVVDCREGMRSCWGAFENPSSKMILNYKEDNSIMYDEVND